MTEPKYKVTMLTGEREFVPPTWDLKWAKDGTLSATDKQTGISLSGLTMDTLPFLLTGGGQVNWPKD